MNEKVNNGVTGIVPQTAPESKPKIPRWAMTPYPGPWQIVRLSVSDNGKARKPIATDTVIADYAVTAYARAGVLYPDAQLGREVVAYPLATMGDGASIDRLAQYTAQKYKKWQIANDNAIFQGLSSQDREDQTQIAALAIWQGLLADSKIDMYTLYKVGYNAICAERDKPYRRKEKTYNPDRLPRVFGTFVAKNGPLGKLFAEAAKNAAKIGKLTARQMDVLDMYVRHWTAAEIAAELGVSRQMVYRHIHSGLYNVLDQMIQLDLANGLRTFGVCGITPEDVYGALENEARKRKN